MAQLKRTAMSKVVTFTMTDEDYERLTQLSQQMGVSRSGVIRAFLRQPGNGKPPTVQAPKDESDK